jgi:hypothetical protein
VTAGGSTSYTIRFAVGRIQSGGGA